MDKREELKNLTKELMDEMTVPIQAEMDAQKESNAKLLETNTELKARLDAMQDKIVTINTKTAGVQKFIFKGFNTDLIKNFKSTVSESDCELIAKIYLDQAKAKISGSPDNALMKAFDGSLAVPVQYGNAVMGLAELSSVALTYANVVAAESPTIKLPAKGTREAVDSQAPGTANTAGQSTIGQITWTIDKRVGTYMEVLNTQIEDANFDIVNEIIIPFQAEAIGQNADDEMFNGTEFTSSISDAPATISGNEAATAAAITFANLNEMFYALQWERGNLNPKWFGSRAALKDIAALVDGDSRPIFQQVPLNGRPSQTLMGSEYVIVPSISDTPADGSIRLAFGDPRQYRIFVRGGTMTSLVNPYIKMKEDITQFICKARMDGNISDHATPGSSGAFCTMKRVE